MKEKSLFDFGLGLRLKEEGVKQVDQNANSLWKQEAFKQLYALAQTDRHFTSDDVWAALEDKATTHEPKALGAVFLKAARKKLICPTGDFIPSKRPQAHGRRLMVWQGVRSPDTMLKWANELRKLKC